MASGYHDPFYVDGDEEGEYTKKIVVPSLENTIVMFNNTHTHFGTTQSDTPARIVLNINLAKAPINNLNNENFEPIDDYF